MRPVSSFACTCEGHHAMWNHQFSDDHINWIDYRHEMSYQVCALTESEYICTLSSIRLLWGNLKPPSQCMQIERMSILYSYSPCHLALRSVICAEEDRKNREEENPPEAHLSATHQKFKVVELIYWVAVGILLMCKFACETNWLAFWHVNQEFQCLLDSTYTPVTECLQALSWSWKLTTFVNILVQNENVKLQILLYFRWSLRYTGESQHMCVPSYGSSRTKRPVRLIDIDPEECSYIWECEAALLCKDIHSFCTSHIIQYAGQCAANCCFQSPQLQVSRHIEKPWQPYPCFPYIL